MDHVISYLLSLSQINFVRFIHVLKCNYRSFIFTAVQYSIVCPNHSLFIHQIVDWPLDSFPFGAMSILYMYMGEHMLAFLLNVYLQVKLLSHNIFMFTFSSYYQTGFQRNCINLYSHQKFLRVPFALHPHQLLVLTQKFSFIQVKLLNVYQPPAFSLKTYKRIGFSLKKVLWLSLKPWLKLLQLFFKFKQIIFQATYVYYCQKFLIKNHLYFPLCY